MDYNNLKLVYCDGNELTDMVIGNCPKLNEIKCNGNHLTELNIQGCSSLQSIICSNNLLTELDLSDWGDLTTIDCGFNNLSELDVSCCLDLRALFCRNNRLTDIDVSNLRNISELDCRGNHLTSINFSSNPELLIDGVLSNGEGTVGFNQDYYTYDGELNLWIYAYPNEGYRFEGWYNDEWQKVSTNSEYKISEANICSIYTAMFVPIGGGIDSTEDPTPGLTPAPSETPSEQVSSLIAGYYFEEEDCLDDWTLIDADGDTKNWMSNLKANVNSQGYESVGHIFSQSYENYLGALNPDNWAITPAIQADLGIYISLWACTQDAAWPSEHFGVYVGNKPDVSDMVELGQYTMTPVVTRDQGNWYNYTFNVDDLFGILPGEIYIAIRHFDCSDWFQLNIDNIEVFVDGYIVSFVDWDGTVIKTQCVENGESAEAPEDPIREGYTFTGWDVDFSCITNNLTVTAQYTPNPYTLTYYMDGEQYASQTVFCDSQIELMVVDSDEYNFSGWMLADCSAVPETMPAHDLNVYGMLACGFVSVTYVGSYNGTVMVPYGASAILPVLDVEGLHYTFTVDGEPWDGKKLTESVTVEVGMDINVYTVTFIDPFDGTVLSVQSIMHGMNAAAPDVPEHHNYVFSGWDIAYTNVKSDLTVTAVYTPVEYSVVFMDGFGNVIETQFVTYQHAAVAPDDPECEGWTFTGWDADFSFVEHDMIINAEWNRNYYTVTFVGVYTGTVIVEHGSDCELPVYNSPYLHYTFTVNGESWDGKCITSDVTVTVSAAVNEVYTVTFLDWDGTVILTQNVYYGSAASAPADPEREGYTFIGWDTEFTHVYSDLTVTALYEQNETPSEYLKGDVNCDGIVDSADITLAAAYAMSAGEVTPQGVINGDMNGDGLLTAADLSALYSFIQG